MARGAKGGKGGSVRCIFGVDIFFFMKFFCDVRDDVAGLFDKDAVSDFEFVFMDEVFVVEACS